MEQNRIRKQNKAIKETNTQNSTNKRQKREKNGACKIRTK